MRLVLVLKIASLAQGYSGVRPATCEALQRLLETRDLSVHSGQGSVGASGDLAPLAHLAAALLGVGQVRMRGPRDGRPTRRWRASASKPCAWRPKEGLALLNGTQVSTALALAGAVRDRECVRGGAGGRRNVGGCAQGQRCTIR